MTRAESYFDLAGLSNADLFAGIEHVWEVFHRLEAYVDSHLTPGIEGRVHEGAFVSGRVWLGPGAVVEPGAYIVGPAIIGPGTVVRHGAYVREYCLIGRDCVIGHATELKYAVLLDEAQAPHFNYVGDSVLGRGVNLGAGTRLANLKTSRANVVVDVAGDRYPTGLRKLGAILGDGVQTGCNVVASPGTLVGRGTHVYPGAVLRGWYPPHTMIKVRQQLEAVPIE